MKTSKLGFVLAGLYLIIAMSAILYTRNSYIYHPEREFNGIWPILVTLPFSLLRVVFKNSTTNMLLIQSTVYAFINSFIIYWIALKLKRNQI